MLVDGRGVPLSLIASGANTHDVKLLAETLDAIVVALPQNKSMHLCADTAYTGEPARKQITQRRYRPHVRGRKEERKHHPKAKPRRWVVERTHSWINRFRKLLVSFEKSKESFVALLSLAAALICWRQSIFIYG